MLVDFHGVELWDYGDRMELQCRGEPTDEQIEAFISAAKRKGWDGIELYGGSPEWQPRARAEAIRQGFPPEKVTLEIDEFAPRMEPKLEPIAAEAEMPEHLRRKLGVMSPTQSPPPTDPAAVIGMGM